MVGHCQGVHSFVTGSKMQNVLESSRFRCDRYLSSGSTFLQSPALTAKGKASDSS